MSNNPFDGLRRSMTWVYAAVFGLIIMVVVAAAYYLIWRSILDHEKELLVGLAYHEVEEWLETGEKPCSEASVRDGSMLAYFVGADGKTVILDQLGDGDAGRTIMRKRDVWPKEDDSARMLRLHGDEEERYRYLGAVVPVVRNGELAGRLYMFKNMEFYYGAAARTLFLLLCVACMLFAGACYVGYLLAGRNIRPIRMMYEKQQQFTADASHEMRTPLAVMKLATEGMAADEDSTYSEFAKEGLGMVRSEVDRMTKLTEDLMTLARSDDGTLPWKQQTINFSRLCEDVADKLELVARDKGMLLSRTLEAGLYVSGDEHTLNRLLIILLDNALKYSPVGSSVGLLAKAERDEVVLHVCDNGIGIADAEKEKVFDRFYRVDKARSRSMGGLGLGLSLALSITLQHGGSIKALDNTPCGTIMEVRLPRLPKD